MSKKVVTFGEILMRLSTPGNLRFQQIRQFDVSFGGSEANVAISIATFGGEVSLVTAFPDNALGKVCLMKLKEHSVNTDDVMTIKGKRLGSYIVEQAADVRAGTVIYDRADSAFSCLKPGMIDWERAFEGAAVFHWSGIDAALTQDLADVCAEAIAVAERMGLLISCDINYRKNLWKYGKTPEEVLYPLMQHSDIMFGSTGEYEKSLGIKAPVLTAKSAEERIDRELYNDFMQQISAKVPRCKHLFTCLRNVITTEHHVLCGVLYSEGQLYTTRTYEVNNVIDSIGVGDAFVGAMIYGCLNYEDNQKKLEFATAGAVLKNTIVGDYNMVSVEEVERLINSGDVELGR